MNGSPEASAEKLADPGWAWAPYEPSPERPWTLPKAGHLYRRAAFGATWPQLEQAMAEGPQRTIDRLLRPGVDVEAFNRRLDGYEASASGSESAEGLRSWWLRRMIETPHPLLEKMTLFWHGHFATSNAKVRSAALMRQHLRLLRSHALGHYGALLEGIARDPAVLVWLDAQANRKARPSENFARVLLGQFSLEQGAYSEEDVREAAKAFTGLFVLRDQLHYFPQEHDEGVKKVLGHEGKFRGDDVVQILLKQPAAPRLVVRKLYRWLISETSPPAEDLLSPLVKSFSGAYDLSRLVETMLRSNVMFSSAAYRQRVKCPVEFALGIIRPLEGVVPTARLAQDLAALGQDLCHPPTAHGWEGGLHWLNHATLLRRANLATGLVAASGPYEGKLDPAALAARYGSSTPAQARRLFVDLLVQGDLDAELSRDLLEAPAQAGQGSAGDLRSFVGALVSLPEFQLA